MNKFTFKALFVFILLVQYAQGQIIVEKFAKNTQLYARNLATNAALIPTTGKVTDSTLYSQAILKIWRNGILINTQAAPLVFNNNIANFAINYALLAELASYDIELHLTKKSTNTDTLIRKATNVVAGDVYIIQGQSNAEAKQWVNSGTAVPAQSPYIRVYGSGTELLTTDTNWYIAQGNGGRQTAGNTGQWGLQMARHIVDSQRIPVAIFNGALGGRPIQYFLRNAANPTDSMTNYGRLLRRLKQTGLQTAVRGIFWYQGEWNASGTCLNCTYSTTNQYITAFNQLRQAWKIDYINTAKFYVFQIRQGCGLPETGVLEIQEALRQLPYLYPDVTIMATNGAQMYTDNCHFTFEDGYKTLGNWIYPIVAHDMYTKPITATNYPPNPEYVYQTNYNQITLTTNTPNLVWDSNIQNDFRIEGTTLTVTSGVVIGNTLVLTFSGALPSNTALSYKGQAHPSAPVVTNGAGIGLLSFYSMPVLTAALSTPDFLGINGKQQNNTNHLYWHTTNNTDIQYFIIEKSKNGEDWQQISKKIMPKTNTIATHTYTHADPYPFDGNNYYAIKVIYNDEKTTRSPIIRLKSANATPAARLYPNPATNQIFVDMPKQYSGATQIIIQNILGATVQSQNFESESGGGTAQITMQHLPQGVYSATIINENAAVQCLKFLVE